MYAQLGSIVFESLKSFSDYTKSGSVTYAEHKPIASIPRLQPTGRNLHELAISMRLHAAFCNPANELASLKQMMYDNEILPLLWGNGKLEGDFVIVDISETQEYADEQGNVFSYLVSCTLKEYSIPDRLQVEQAKSREQAKAVGNKKTVAKKKVNPPACPRLIASIVTKIDNHAKAINVTVLEKGGSNSIANRNTILHHLSTIRLLVEDLLKRCDDPQSCASTLPDLKYRTQQVFISDNNFNREVANNNNARAPDENKILAATVRNLKVAAGPLIQQSITGQ